MKQGILLVGMALLVACSSSNGGGNGSGGNGGVAGNGGAGGNAGMGGNDFSSNPPTVIGTDERPASVTVPRDYDPGTTYPLLMVLHGAGADGQTQAGYFQLFPLVDEKQFVMVYPDGTLNAEDRRVWNGAGCCADDDSVDDVGYITGLIEEAKQTYNVDPNRVYLMGHSNGGFLSFRLACEASPLFTAMMSLAGGTYWDPADCEPGTPPVSVLVVHGTADGTIPYEGSPNVYPGAVAIAERSAESAGCDPNTTTPLGSTDFVPAVPAEETDKVSYSTSCDDGLAVELWTINDGGHIPFFTIDFADQVTDWLFRLRR
jgi:polyhydroxybutyrate depolymerase